MKTKITQSITVIIAAATLSLASCATYNQPLVCAGTSLAVSNVLQYGVKPAQRAEVAGQIAAVSDIFNTYSNGQVPTAAQLKLLMDRYLPNNDSKTITETNVLALYSAFYEQIKNKAPTVQLGYVRDFLSCAKNGAAPFLSAGAITQLNH